MTTRTGAALAALWLAAATIAPGLAPGRAAAATQVPAASGRLNVDVWINKEEGGVYRSGEKMQVFFRASEDAYVLIYNIDTEGYVHLIYPFRPRDPLRVRGGETNRVPARHDPYDLVAEGPEGVEYVVALASPLPFEDLPWYLAPGLSEEPRQPSADGDDLEDGVIVGDPYVGMERIYRRLVPEGREDQVASADTYFYIERRVEYPRYVCADCHHRTYWFDPYIDHCSVIEIRIDATWARYAPLRVRSARPRYYYNVRSGAPTRYRAWKERWSSLDGPPTLRSKFIMERQRQTREVTPRRQSPPEFKDLRRYRPGRFYQGRDEVLRLRERLDRRREEARDRRREADGRESDQVTPREQRGRSNDKVSPPARRENGERRPPDARESKPKRPEEPRDPPKQPEAKERDRKPKDSGETRDRSDRDSKEERGRSEPRRDPAPRERDRGERPGRGR
jgi:hypothetical protein